MQTAPSGSTTSSTPPAACGWPASVSGALRSPLSPLPSHCISTAFFTALPLSFHCLSTALSLHRHCPFHCPSTVLPLPFHCPFTASPLPSTTLPMPLDTRRVPRRCGLCECAPRSPPNKHKHGLHLNTTALTASGFVGPKALTPTPAARSQAPPR